MADIHGAVSDTKYTYDVFLSFRGEDTRHTFTCHLYNALHRKGMKTFMDNKEMKVGEPIAPELLKAIEESRISIVVFSQNYAHSSWCLDELVKIHECMELGTQHVYPIFYKVDPSHVRHQKGRYGEAMTNYEKQKDSEKVPKWRLALTNIANLKGEHLKLEEGRDESEFIDDLVSKIFIKVSPKDLSRNEHIVGRECRAEELKSLLHLESRNITCLLGIHGTGGIGKTTLAKALYDSIYKQFVGSTFLFNVRETSNQKGLKHLQEELLADILGVNAIQLKSEEEGTRTIESTLNLKRVLIVLDDVDDIKQLNNLAGRRDWFGLGSRIIITTRDTHLLDLCRVEKRHEVRLLKDQESLKLFCQSAFGKSRPETKYEDVCNRAMQCCKGLPLALKVLGSHMVGKDLVGWEDALVRYEESPHPGVQSVLRTSYDSLPGIEKEIFLDVACFFKGYTLEYVKGFSSGDGITTLVNRSLLTVDKYHRLVMHDLIQDMGREIVKEEADNEVGKRSRLWFHEDVLQVLNDNNGSDKIQGIMLDPPQREEVNCIDTVFEKMKNLRILIVRKTSFLHEPRYLPNNLRLLDWKNYPSQSFLSYFYPRNIRALYLRKCPRLVLKHRFQSFQYLTCMCISFCGMVNEFPDVSGAKNLRELRLHGCENLVSIHGSVGFLSNLVVLSCLQCSELQSFVPTINLSSLEELWLGGCLKLANFPEIEETMIRPLEINMSHTAIKKLPESIEKLIGLKSLDMYCCKSLESLPNNLFMLPNLVTLKIRSCDQLRKSFIHGCTSACAKPKLATLDFSDGELSDQDLKVIICNLPNLKDLNVSGNRFFSLPRNIRDSKLTCLDVSRCYDLKEIPELSSSVQKVDARHCDDLTSETSNILWSQVRKEVKRLEVVMPKSEIPEWFDHVSKVGRPVFKARGKFPTFALALLFGTEITSYWLSFRVRLFIDGESRGGHSFMLTENQVILCDVRLLFRLEEWEDVSRGVGNDWKTVQIFFGTLADPDLRPSSWGVYVYSRHETNMENIQFLSE